MKKYVKPVMESEVFTSNEYIGACWLITCGCNETDEYLRVVGNNLEQALYNHDENLKNFGQQNGIYVVTGELFGDNGCHDKECKHEGLNVDWKCEQWGEKWSVPWGVCKLLEGIDSYFTPQDHHHVEVKYHSNGSGPNAS